MENNYNFHINPKEPSSKEIRQHMDFDALLGQLDGEQQQEQKQFRIRRLVYITGIAAAVLILVMFIPNLTNSPNINSSDYFNQQAYINPPLPQIEIQAIVKNISDAHQGGIIEYTSGSRLVIPAAAFMNNRGKLVGGEVEIHYRELHDFIDFFVSGVPMAYDSVGLQRYLTSSGMVEIYAEQNGKRLTLASGKTIQVELISEVQVDDYFTLPKYSVYQLDTASRSWQYRNIDMVQFLEEEQWSVDGQLTSQQLWQQQITRLNENYQEALADLQIHHPLPAAPYKPTQADGKRPTFDLDFQNGELALDPLSQVQQADIDRLHNGTIWEIAPNSPAIDTRAFNVVWESVRLKKLNQHQYELTLVHSKNEETLIVEPVLLGDDYQQAVNAYQNNLQAYNQAVAQRETEIAISRDSLQIVFNDRKIALQYEFEAGLQNGSQKVTRKLINRFVVNEFGVWACGKVESPEQTVKDISFIDEEGNTFEAVTAYVVNDDQNTLYRYMAGEGMTVNLQTGSKHLLWVVDEQGSLSLSYIKEVSQDGTQVELHPIDDAIQTEEQLRRVLKL